LTLPVLEFRLPSDPASRYADCTIPASLDVGVSDSATCDEVLGCDLVNSPSYSVLLSLPLPPYILPYFPRATFESRLKGGRYQNYVTNFMATSGTRMINLGNVRECVPAAACSCVMPSSPIAFRSLRSSSCLCSCDTLFLHKGAFPASGLSMATSSGAVVADELWEEARTRRCH
jgi:hypothetical protein